MRIAITVSYDGTDFCGWQVQPNGITVQQTIEDGIEKLTGERVRVTGSGRTDAGVHAKGQVAHFDTNSTIPPERFYLALNTVLPPSVRVLESKRVNDKFDACRGAKVKTYIYSFYISETELPLKERYALRIDKSVDVIKMQESAKLFIGTKDFDCFSSSGKEVKTTVRTIYTAKVTKRGKDVFFTVSGNGFLYNMVRIMAGTLLEIGKGTLKPEDINKAFQSGKRDIIGKTLPAKGLCLKEVRYKGK